MAQKDSVSMGYVFSAKGMKVITPDDFEELHQFEFLWGSGKVERVYLYEGRGKKQPLHDAHYQTVWNQSASLIFQNIYENIDMYVRPSDETPGKMYLEFLVFPGANPQDISFDFNQSLFVNQDKMGTVKVDNMVGSLLFSKARASQSLNGSDKEKIDLELMLDEDTLQVMVGDYEPSGVLTVAFEISYSSQLGAESYTASLKREP